MAAAISPGRALEDISGENQDAASFNRSAPAAVHRMHGGSLPPASDAAAVRGIYAPARMDVGLWQIHESCFAAANLFLSVLAYLWLRKKGVACFSAL